MTRWNRPEPDRDPHYVQTVGAVQRAVDAIDHSDEQWADILVAAFLCAAWPTSQAQDQ